MEPGKPFPIDSFVTDLAEVKPAKETPLKIPSFSLPIGFHTLSLFFIASYYDGNATAFFKHFVFEDKSERFNNLDKVDFTKSLDTIVNFIFGEQRPERVLRGLSDRRCDIARMAMLKAIGTEEYITNEVPRGAEDGKPLSKAGRDPSVRKSGEGNRMGAASADSVLCGGGKRADQ